MKDKAPSSGKKRPEGQALNPRDPDRAATGRAVLWRQAEEEKLVDYELFVLERPGLQPDDG